MVGVVNWRAFGETFVTLFVITDPIGNAPIFVAITLNFVIFRAAPGDATTALRCLSCTDEVRAQLLTADRSDFFARFRQ